MNLRTTLLFLPVLFWILIFNQPSQSAATDPIPQFAINEFMASNDKIALDEDGDSSDWIELYNAGDDTIRLLDMSITDDASEPVRWRFPDVVLEPGGFLLVWASGKDKTNGQLHSNFKLGAAGEFIGLYTADGQLVDALEFGTQHPDISQARIPDGSGPFEATDSPTPGSANERDVPASHAVEFSPESGFFNESVTVELRTNVADAAIHYTTDGSSVNPGSSLYSEPLEIEKTTVIRARAFKGNTEVSDDISQIFLVDYDGTLPVLSYATDNSNLFGQAGIFENPDEVGREWERPVSINYVVPGGRGFRINAGMRTHGGRSRRDEFPKLSTRLYFRSDYGDSKLRYRVFDSRQSDTFDRLVVHSGGSSDQFHRRTDKVNRQWSLIRDPLNHRMWREHDGAVSASQPVVLFINGEPWGVFHLRERVDESYLAANYGIQSADLLRPDNDQLDIEAGDKRAWNSMFSFIKRKDMDDEDNYERAQELINIDNFIDFHIFNVFAGNWDMPHTNIYFFRERTDAAKWHWVMWDTDISYGSLGTGLPASTRTLEWATRDTLLEGVAGTTDDDDWLWTTLIMRQLLDNENFETRFVNRFADLMNTTLHPDHIAELVDEMAQVLRPNIPFETEAWSKATRDDWENGIEVIKNWAEARPKHQRDHLRKVLGVGGNRNLQLRVAGQGKIRINSIKPKNYPWQGVYFRNVPIELEALPRDGYVFSHWSGASPSPQPIVTVELDSDQTVTAHFSTIDGDPEPPEFLALEPDSGFVGTEVGILGKRLREVTGVLFGDRAADFETTSDTTLTATVPDSALSGHIILLSVAGAVASIDSFVVLPPVSVLPELLSVFPDSGFFGQTVRLHGRRLHEVERVIFNDVPAPLLEVAADSSLVTEVPASASSGFLAIETATDTIVSLLSFEVLRDSSVSDTAGFVAVADAYVRSDFDSLNFGSTETLRIGQTPYGRFAGYLRFDLSGLDGGVRKATLHLYRVAGSAAANILVAPNDWDEAALTWANAPEPSTEAIGNPVPGESRGPVQVDVSSAVAVAGVYSFVIATDSDDELKFSAREGLFPPRLVVVLDSTLVGVPGTDALPSKYELAPAYPNPFNAETTVQYALPRRGHVKLAVFNVKGQVVRRLVDEVQPAGVTIARWNGRDEQGNEVGSGVYFIRLKAGQKMLSRVLSLQK